MRSLITLSLVALLALAAAGRSADEKPGKPEVGKPAPAVTLPATSIDSVLPEKKDARTITLKEFEGKKNVVLFFFPKAMTPGCTAQCKGFRDLQKEFAKADTVTIGISTDKIEDQLKFTRRDDLNFPLFADADKDVAKAFGVLGKSVASRVTFVIDKKGVVRKIYQVKAAKDNPAEVLEYVKKELADK